MPKKQTVPSEFEDVAYKGDINAVHARIDKCYSSEKYEEFQGSVEKIIWRYIKSFIGFATFIWLVSILGSMILQKYLNIF